MACSAGDGVWWMISRVGIAPQPRGGDGRDLRGTTTRRVSAEHLTTDDNLEPWVEAGVARARSLPPKAAKKAKQ